MRNTILSSFFICLFALFIPAAHAQESFSELHLTVTGNGIMGGNTLLKHWSPTGGIGLEVGTPYNFGDLEVGLRYMRYNAENYENSGFHSGFIFLGWYYNYFVDEKRDLSIVPGVRLGNRFTVHDQDKIYGDGYRFNKTESEFSYELQFRLQYRINDRFGFYTSIAYNRTLYHISYAEWMGGVGFSVIFKTPDKLKSFLR
ncbi:MAG: hypothetical protein R3220_10470 [Balneolaceae bacterium]|nr:hypothetical protein [Balneolaceae bacterium]